MGWLSQSRLEAAEARAAAAEQKVRVLEDRLQLLSLAKEEQLEAARKDQQRLIDRILELNGQPPLYEKPAIHVVPQQSADLPEVPPTVRIDDIHIAARRAMRDGSFNLPKGTQ